MKRTILFLGMCLLTAGCGGDVSRDRTFPGVQEVGTIVGKTPQRGIRITRVEVETGTLYVAENSSGSAVSITHVPKQK